jgi:glycerol uptake facilitator protein
MRDEPSQLQRLLSEGLGTAFLVFIGVGSVPATLILNGSQPFTMAQLGMISFAFGLVIVAAIYTFGHISGCHINPAVTIGLAMTGNFAWRDVPAYIGAQVVGAIAGGAAIIAALGTKALDVGLGVNSYGTGWGTAAAAELLGTFVLVFTILGVIHRKAVPGFAGLSIGLVVFAIIVAVGPTSGGSINPARYVGPFLLEAVFGHSGAVKWSQFPVYIIAQLIGGVLAAVIYPLVFRTPADRPGPFAEVDAVSAPAQAPATA